MITHQEILESPVRALSWKEPFGSLMLHDKVETRTMNTKYRGLVLICTSAIGYPINPLTEITGHNNFQRILNLVQAKKLLLKNSHAIAIGYIKNTRLMKPSVEDEIACFVKYNGFPPRYCYFFEDVTPIKPIPWKGKQGWSIVTQEQKQLIEPIYNI